MNFLVCLNNLTKIIEIHDGTINIYGLTIDLLIRANSVCASFEIRVTGILKGDSDPFIYTLPKEYCPLTTHRILGYGLDILVHKTGKIQIQGAENKIYDKGTWCGYTFAHI